MNKKGNIIKRIGNYLTEIRGELKKVTWPTKNDMIKTTIAVIVASVIFGIYLTSVDTIFRIVFDYIRHLFK